MVLRVKALFQIGTYSNINVVSKHIFVLFVVIRTHLHKSQRLQNCGISRLVYVMSQLVSFQFVGQINCNGKWNLV